MIRYSIYSILISLFIGFNISAQKISLGVESGIISSLNSDYEFSDIENRRNTYFIGINANYHLNKFISINTGLHYMRQGYKHETCYLWEDGFDYDIVGKIDYLNTPLYFDFNLGKNNRIITSIGVNSQFNIQAIQDYPVPTGGCEIFYAPDLSDTYNSVSFSGMLGLGYKIINTDKLELSSMIRFIQGLDNTYSNRQAIQVYHERKYHSGLLTMRLNYKI